MLIIVKCTDCGKEYALEEGEKLSEFRCKCGGDLEYKKYTTQEPPKSKKHLKTISISIIALILIFIALFAFFNSGLGHVYSSGNQTNKSNNTTAHIANQTYAANGITFNYPADWREMHDLNSTSRWGYTDPLVAFYDPKNNLSEYDDIDTYFYIKQRNVDSLEEQLSSYRSDIAEIGQTEVSERKITVNGMKAVELIKTWQGDGKQYRALTVHIEAIPGSVYYRIGCVTPADKFNATLPKFELIVYSFKYSG